VASNFTELCCRSGGSNLNAGSRTGSSTEPGTAADLTYAAGGWVNATNVFTPASGDPVADGVAVGDFAALDTGGTEAAWIARVTARTSTTITLSATVAIGTKPANGTYTLRIGGAWAGPSGTITFPFNIFTAALVKNVSGAWPRINCKDNQTYSMTAAITYAGTLTTIRGYTNTYEDSGRATFDGGATGAAYVLFTVSGVSCALENMIFRNNGDSGNAAGVLFSGARGHIQNCVFHDFRGFGLSATGGIGIYECEVYACNGSNTASQGGFNCASSQFVRCISHDNVGSNSSGFVSTLGGIWFNCIADTNGASGFSSSGNVHMLAVACDAYNNVSHGINAQNGGAAHIESCNLLKNGTGGTGFGINGSSNLSGGGILSCGFGSGTQANASGATNAVVTLVETGTVTYAADVTPWVDPTTGDFRINLAAAENTGRGNFTETAASYSGTVGYPDIGAAIHQAASGGNIIMGS
jgi:fibronectin-binding autotransporter adhesin